MEKESDGHVAVSCESCESFSFEVRKRLIGSRPDMDDFTISHETCPLPD